MCVCMRVFQGMTIKDFKIFGQSLLLTMSGKDDEEPNSNVTFQNFKDVIYFKSR